MVGDRSVPPADAAPQEPSPSLDQVAQHLNDARNFAAIYLSAQAGRIRVGLRNAFLFALLSFVFVIVITTFAVVAVVLFCHGAAGGIGALLGGRTWAGELIVGAIVLGGSATFSWRLVWYIRKISRRRTVAGYLKTKIPK